MKNSLNSLFKLTLTVFLSSSAMAQLPELGSPSTINGASTTARFFGGASSDNGASFASSFDYDQQIDINVKVQVESSQVNTMGNLYIIITPNNQYLIRVESGGYEVWDVKLANLKAAFPAVTLQTNHTINIVDDVALGPAGVSDTTLRIYLAYDSMAAEGEIYYSGTPLSVTINDRDNRIQFESFFDEYTQPISTLGFNKVTYSVGEYNDTKWVNGKYTVEDYAFLQVQIDGSHGGKNLNNPDSEEYTVGVQSWMTNASHVIENDINQDGHSDFIVWLQTFGDFNTLPGTRALQFVNDGDGHFQLDCGVFENNTCPLVFGESSSMTNLLWTNNEDAPVKAENTGINRQYDLNGDGNKDLFNTGLLWLTEDGKFVESRNNLPDFMFENLNADGVDVGIFVHDHAVGDLNGDGFNDIFMPNAIPVRSQNNGTKFFMLNDGNGDFKDFSFKVGHHPDFATSTTIADFDGDGFGDIALGWSAGVYVNQGGDSVGGIYWGNADMDYTRDYTALPEGYYETNIAFDMAATDVNADGLLDLVISNTQNEPYYKGNVLQALTNNGDRTFSDAAFRGEDLIEGINNGVSYIYILDFNHDGVDDILVTSQDPAYALINNGDGTYTETSQFAVPDTHSGLFPSYPVEVDGKYNYDFIGWDIVSNSLSQTISSFFISLNSPSQPD